MKSYSFYHVATGLLTGNTYQGPDGGFVTIDGHAAIEGIHDSATKRVDLASMTVVDYTPPPADVSMVAAGARRDRDLRLSACDWVVSRATETAHPIPDEWRIYRQALRDVPAQQGFPLSIDWPRLPAA